MSEAMGAPARIVVLMATFNRRETTKRCLSALLTSVPDNVDLEIHVTDASSSDGTPEMIRSDFPEVRITTVSSDHYWAESMRAGWEAEAARGLPDFWLWLNDDVIPGPDGLAVLLETARKIGSPAVVGGAMLGSRSDLPTYTGYLRGPWWHRMEMTRLDLSDEYQVCDALNGNFVLADSSVDKSLGGFPKDFTHAMADLDYTLRAKHRGSVVALAPGALGFCESNSSEGTWTDRRLPRSTRWRKLLSPKGLPPRQWIVFCLRHGGITGVLTALSPYVKTIVR